MTLTTIQTLCLGLKGQDCTKVYVVSQGDICFSVAKKAGIPLDVLFKNNPNINKGCTNIYPGEVSHLSTDRLSLCSGGDNFTVILWLTERHSRSSALLQQPTPLIVLLVG